MENQKIPDITFIIVNYNTYKYTIVAIESILRYHQDSEIIVIDNNSPAEDYKLLKSELNDYRIKIIQNKKNDGFAKANNIAMRNVRSQYVLLLNPDCELNMPLDELLNFAKENSGIGLISCKLLNSNGTHQPSIYKRNSLIEQFSILSGITPLASSQDFTDYSSPRKVYALRGAALLIKKKIFDEVGGFDTDFFMYGEEIDLAIRLLKNRMTNWYFPGTTITHHQNKSGEQFSDKTFSYRRKSMLILFKKHHSSISYYSLKYFQFLLFSLKYISIKICALFNSSEYSNKAKKYELVLFGKNDE